MASVKLKVTQGVQRKVTSAIRVVPKERGENIHSFTTDLAPGGFFVSGSRPEGPKMSLIVYLGFAFLPAASYPLPDLAACICVCACMYV